MKKNVHKLFLSLYLILNISLLSACFDSPEIEYAVKHLRDQTGEQITEVLSYEQYEGLDNTDGQASLQVQIELQRDYRNQIIERLTTDEISSQGVRDKIVELYKLSPNDPEGTVNSALCPLSVVIPAGSKAVVTIEWTERWVEGVVNQGVEGQGKRLGTYSVFLGYLEPCSLVSQENK